MMKQCKTKAVELFPEFGPWGQV